MDDFVVRSRYSRPGSQNRRKKRSVKESNTFIEGIIRKVIICILILVVLGIIKSANTPTTIYLMDNVKWALTQSIDYQSFYKSISGYFTDLISDEKGIKEKTSNDMTVPEITNTSNNGETKEAKDQQKIKPDQNKGSEEASNVVPGEKGSDIQKDNDKPVSVKDADRFILPVNGFLGSLYGERIHPIKKTTEFHKGIDIEAAKGDSIKAASDGEIIEEGTNSTYGKYIKIRHDGGLETVYAHCAVLSAKKDQKVKQGEVIAKVGDTGTSTGAHLHFEIWKDGKPVDPLTFVKVPLKE